MYDNGGVISYLTSGQTDLAVYHLPGTLCAFAKGAKIKIVGSLIEQPLRALIYREDPRVSKPSDLSGKVLGYCIGGPNTAFLDFLLAQGDISPSHKKNVSVDLISAIGTNSVDFIYGGFWNIEPFQLEALGVKTRSFPIQMLGVPPYPEMIILANSETKASQPEFVAGFKRALQKGIDYCKNNPESAFSIYIEHNPDKRDATLAWEKEAWKATYPLFVDRQELNISEITRFYNWQIEQKIINTFQDPYNLI